MSHCRPLPLGSAASLEGSGTYTPQKAAVVSHHLNNGLSNNLYINCRGTFTSSRDPVRFAQSNRGGRAKRAKTTLYTPEERRRRDTSRWTIVQAILAPIQFVVFLVSLGLVIRYLASGEGLLIATGSVVIKTLTLYAIMITGSIWEREVFGRYLFARPFFWEDVFSIVVLALHTIYLVALFTRALDPPNLMFVALAAYAAYAVNASQFLFKLRAARREVPNATVGAASLAS